MRFGRLASGMGWKAERSAFPFVRGFVRAQKVPSSDTDAAGEPAACSSVQNVRGWQWGCILGRLQLVLGLPRPAHRKILILRLPGAGCIVVGARRSAHLALRVHNIRAPVILENERVWLPSFDPGSCCSVPAMPCRQSASCELPRTARAWSLHASHAALAGLQFACKSCAGDLSC